MKQWNFLCIWWCSRECKRSNNKCVWVVLVDIIQGALDNATGIEHKGALQDLYKNAEKGSTEAALKSAL